MENRLPILACAAVLCCLLAIACAGPSPPDTNTATSTQTWVAPTEKDCEVEVNELTQAQKAAKKKAVDTEVKGLWAKMQREDSKFLQLGEEEEENKNPYLAAVTPPPMPKMRKRPEMTVGELKRKMPEYSEKVLKPWLAWYYNRNTEGDISKALMGLGMAGTSTPSKTFCKEFSDVTHAYKKTKERLEGQEKQWGYGAKDKAKILSGMKMKMPESEKDKTAVMEVTGVDDRAKKPVPRANVRGATKREQEKKALKKVSSKGDSEFPKGGERGSSVGASGGKPGSKDSLAAKKKKAVDERQRQVDTWWKVKKTKVDPQHVGNCPDECFGMGDCVMGHCECYQGYYGPDCSLLGVPSAGYHEMAKHIKLDTKTGLTYVAGSKTWKELHQTLQKDRQSAKRKAQERKLKKKGGKDDRKVGPPPGDHDARASAGPRFAHVGYDPYEQGGSSKVDSGPVDPRIHADYLANTLHGYLSDMTGTGTGLDCSTKCIPVQGGFSPEDLGGGPPEISTKSMTPYVKQSSSGCSRKAQSSPHKKCYNIARFLTPEGQRFLVSTPDGKKLFSELLLTVRGKYFLLTDPIGRKLFRFLLMTKKGIQLLCKSPTGFKFVEWLTESDQGMKLQKRTKEGKAFGQWYKKHGTTECGKPGLVDPKDDVLKRPAEAPMVVWDNVPEEVGRPEDGEEELLQLDTQQELEMGFTAIIRVRPHGWEKKARQLLDVMKENSEADNGLDAPDTHENESDNLAKMDPLDVYFGGHANLPLDEVGITTGLLEEDEAAETDSPVGADDLRHLFDELDEKKVTKTVTKTTTTRRVKKSSSKSQSTSKAPPKPSKPMPKGPGKLGKVMVSEPDPKYVGDEASKVFSAPLDAQQDPKMDAAAGGYSCSFQCKTVARRGCSRMCIPGNPVYCRDVCVDPGKVWVDHKRHVKETLAKHLKEPFSLHQCLGVCLKFYPESKDDTGELLRSCAQECQRRHKEQKSPASTKEKNEKKPGNAGDKTPKKDGKAGPVKPAPAKNPNRKVTQAKVNVKGKPKMKEDEIEYEAGEDSLGGDSASEFAMGLSATDDGRESSDDGMEGENAFGATTNQNGADSEIKKIGGEVKDIASIFNS